MKSNKTTFFMKKQKNMNLYTCQIESPHSMYLNNIGFLSRIVEPAGDFLSNDMNGIENREAEIAIRDMGVFRFSQELNLLHVFLELPIIYKSLLPFWY